MKASNGSQMCINQKSSQNSAFHFRGLVADVPSPSDEEFEQMLELLVPG